MEALTDQERLDVAKGVLTEIAMSILKDVPDGVATADEALSMNAGIFAAAGAPTEDAPLPHAGCIAIIGATMALLNRAEVYEETTHA